MSLVKTDTAETDGLRLEADSHVFAFITYLNFLLENEIDPFKSIFKGIFLKKCSQSSNIFFAFWARKFPF